MTKFCNETVHIPAIDADLVIDGNTKIGGWPEPKPNALSLPAPSTCPGSTEACRASCYASWEGTKIPPELRARYEANERAIRAALAMPDAGFAAGMQLARWIAKNCQDVGFRWHVSGDVFSDQYAWWIVAVVTASPEVDHWIYTRTLRAISTLTLAPNLVVNISADRKNLHGARWKASAYGCRLCYLWQGEAIPELPDGSVIFPDYPQRGSLPQLVPPRVRRMFCPADIFGQGEHRRCGVCTKCGNPRHREDL
jgi:hypothetical protein